MNIDKINHQMQTWLSSKDNKLFYVLFYLVTSINYNPVIKIFRDRLKTIDYNFIKGSEVSGSVCFFGSLLMSWAQTGKINNIDELFTLSACYMIIDHYIDSPDISKKDKEKTIRELMLYIHSPYKTNNPILLAIGKRYTDMIKVISSCKSYVDKLFMTEIKTSYLQQQQLHRKDYMQICYDKGSQTCEAIQSILGLPVTQAEKSLGFVIQSLDDLLDVKEDLQAGINTIATYDLQHYKTLDKLWIYTLDQIYNLDNKYNLMKIILMISLITAINTCKDCYSEELIRITAKHNYFPNMTKYSLNDKFEVSLGV